MEQTKPKQSQTPKAKKKRAAKSASKTPARRRKRKKHSRLRPELYLLLMLITLVFLGLILLFCLHRAFTGTTVPATPTPSEVEQEPTVSVSEIPEMPPNLLEKECFSTTSEGIKTYSSDTVTGLVGIDVSSHQLWIDWNAVAGAGVDFAIIQAAYRGYSDGLLYQDEYFEYNISAALDAGLEVGVYFFSQALSAEEAREEAEMILSLVEGYDLSFPIYFDWEPIDNAEARTDSFTSSQLMECALTFCQTIEDAGYPAGIYFNLAQASEYYRLWELTDYDFWLADYHETPILTCAFQAWQYTNTGTLPGISGQVDLNLYFKPIEP